MPTFKRLRRSSPGPPCSRLPPDRRQHPCPRVCSRKREDPMPPKRQKESRDLQSREEVNLVVEKPETTPVTPEEVGPAASPKQLAPWYVRTGALAIDVGPAVAVMATVALVALMVPLRSPWWWLLVSVAVAVGLLTVVNRWVLPTHTGWSLGRALLGITVVRPDDGDGEI